MPARRGGKQIKLQSSKPECRVQLSKFKPPISNRSPATCQYIGDMHRLNR